MSPSETSLFLLVDDPKLHQCLTNLRVAIEPLWAPGAPRIVQDFTDHGMDHYQRIAGYVGKILESKTPEAKPLSPIEMFLLLSGIYLHDVGMQCDVTNEDHKEIKLKAEQLGADFGGVEFTATGAARYSLDEQKAIRKNHHYLSAAWIDYAHRTGKTSLGLAAKQIPYDLVQDIMEVCLHHTSLDIEDCPRKGARDTRKRLVAAMLRFADELDIAWNRVEMAHVTDFVVNPENQVYWCLHNLTEVTFPRPGVYKIVVRVREEDYETFAEIIRLTYIDKFHRKNKGALEVLSDQGFELSMSAESGVCSIPHAPPLPVFVRDALQALASSQLAQGSSANP